MNHNVLLTFLYRIGDGICTGVWSSSVLSNYISVSQGAGDLANEKVGIAQALQGTFLVATAIPAAWLSSWIRRDTILRGLGFVSYAAAVATWAALNYFDGNQQYLVLCAGLSLWGVAQANAPVLDALFADSVPTGRRGSLYTWLHISYILSQGLGPALAALVFYLRGDEWSIERMKWVIVLGMALALVPSTLLLCFNDDKTLGEESEGLLKSARSRSRTRPSMDLASGGLNQPLLSGEDDAERGAGDEEDEEQPGALLLATPGSATDEDLDGFNTPGAQHSPLTGQDLYTQQLQRLQGASPETPTRRTTPAASQPADNVTTPADVGQQDSTLSAVPLPDPESHAIEFSDDASTIYSRRSGLSAPPSAYGSAIDDQLGQADHATHDPPSVTATPSQPSNTNGVASGPVTAPAVSETCANTSAFASGQEHQDTPVVEASKETVGVDGQSATPQEVSAGGAPLLLRASSPDRSSTAGSHAPPAELMRISNMGLSTTSLDAWLPSRAPSIASGGASPRLKHPDGATLQQAGSDAAGVSDIHLNPSASGFGLFQNISKGSPARSRLAASVVARNVDGALSRAWFGGEESGGGAAGEASSGLPRIPEAMHEAASPSVHANTQRSLSQRQGRSSIEKVMRRDVQIRISASRSPSPASGKASSRRWKAPVVPQPHYHLNKRFLCMGPESIPAILAATDCVMGLASGMTIKFFPIFFRQQVRLSPVFVNLMYCAVPLCLSLAAAFARRESLTIGKVPTMVVNRALGILLLFWIAAHVEVWQQPGIMVPIYIIRTSIMNANYPIQRAILMDYVTKEHRAKWASLESVTSFGWSGSAMLGGFLIHNYGFQITFFITAVMQALGWALSLLLLPLVPLYDAPHPSAVPPSTARVRRARSRSRSPVSSRGS